MNCRALRARRLSVRRTGDKRRGHRGSSHARIPEHRFDSDGDFLVPHPNHTGSFLDNGGWTIVELGDGQVAGLPSMDLAPEFFMRVDWRRRHVRHGEVLGTSYADLVAVAPSRRPPRRTLASQ